MAKSPAEFYLHYTGTYSLSLSMRIAAQASFIADYEQPFLDLAFALEGSWDSVAVRVTQDADGLVAQVLANPANASTEAVRSSLHHILSLAPDGLGFDAVGSRDLVIGRLQMRLPGLRPILFPSSYEAAARAIIGHRLPVRRAAGLALRLAARDGVALDVAGVTAHAFPAPSRLATMATMQGLSERKVEQLRSLGAAVSDGWLASERIRAMPMHLVSAHLQQLAGIGPFSAELILIRGIGDPDAFPLTELRLQRAMAAAYRLGEQPDLETLVEISDRWRPYRSWAGLLMRNAAMAE